MSVSVVTKSTILCEEVIDDYEGVNNRNVDEKLLYDLCHA